MERRLTSALSMRGRRPYCMESTMKFVRSVIVFFVGCLICHGAVHAQDHSEIAGAFGLELGQVLEQDLAPKKKENFGTDLILYDVTVPKPSRHFNFYNVNICPYNNEIQAIYGIQTFASVEEATPHYNDVVRVVEKKYGPPADEGKYFISNEQGTKTITLSPPSGKGDITTYSIEYQDSSVWEKCNESETKGIESEDMETL